MPEGTIRGRSDLESSLTQDVDDVEGARHLKVRGFQSCLAGTFDVLNTVIDEPSSLRCDPMGATNVSEGFRMRLAHAQFVAVMHGFEQGAPFGQGAHVGVNPRLEAPGMDDVGVGEEEEPGLVFEGRKHVLPLRPHARQNGIPSVRHGSKRRPRRTKGLQLSQKFRRRDVARLEPIEEVRLRVLVVNGCEILDAQSLERPHRRVVINIVEDAPEIEDDRLW